MCCGFDGFVEPAVLDRIGIELFLERLQQHSRTVLCLGNGPSFKSATVLTSR
jgi:hypothetical protein